MHARAPPMGWGQFFRRLGREFRADGVPDLAAAATFFLLLALFPFLLFLVALSSLFIDPATAEVLIVELGRIAPQQVADLVGERLRALAARESVGVLTVGAALALWSASSGVLGLQRGLNRVFGVFETRPFWKVRLIGFTATLAGAAFLLVAVLLSILTPVVVAALGGGWVGLLARVLRLPVSGLIVAVVWAFALRFLPNVRGRLRVFSPGTLVAVALWLLVSWGFSYYVAHFGQYEVIYGALGSAIVLLLWLWLSVIAFLLGAEINSVLYPPQQRPEGRTEK
jgi:membrane protein